jgi:hypothetical protein
MVLSPYQKARKNPMPLAQKISPLPSLFSGTDEEEVGPKYDPRYTPTVSCVQIPNSLYGD